MHIEDADGVFPDDNIGTYGNIPRLLESDLLHFDDGVTGHRNRTHGTSRTGILVVPDIGQLTFCGFEVKNFVGPQFHFLQADDVGLVLLQKTLDDFGQFVGGITAFSREILHIVRYHTDIRCIRCIS